ncbi:hypothetical protein Mrose_01455 [Calidithermus roseus]|uniref:DUF3105 domain-containing protein n=2 Tax=Calidithermus roseus TaxID=1644118 RepID=A0A399EY11_9DEIN|nr:hypothetical protein Mrose_01455 [Calidithermus roseus]
MGKSARKQAMKYASKAKPSPWPWVIGGVIVLAVAGWGFMRWQSQQGVPSLESLIEQGKPALAQVQSQPDYGRSHANIGTSLSYATDPPTSGTHWFNWTEPGFYSRSEPREKLVHSLEHGNVVIYYDQPSEEALKTLRAWASRYRGQWDGLVVVPKQGLGQTIELTAWTKLLRLENWDAAAAAAFIDAYRGRGPENPVR